MPEINTLFYKNGNVAWKSLDDSVILIDEQERELIELNAVGAEIWRCLDGKKITDIIEHICTVFEVSEKKAAKDVEKFIKKLKDMELIEKRK